SRALRWVPAPAFPRACFRGDERSGILDRSPSQGFASPMASLDTVSITILLGALIVLAGIMSSLVALRFGAPLLMVFLLIGVLAGEAGPGGIRFDDVRAVYLIGSMA